jgi:hypothetical protein
VVVILNGKGGMGAILEGLKKKGKEFASKNFSSEDEIKSRLAICNECPAFIKATSTCKKCGCFMILKAKIKQVTCPIGKW